MQGYYPNNNNYNYTNVWTGCCETVTVRNTSDQVIQMKNASIDISRPDLAVTR